MGIYPWRFHNPPNIFLLLLYLSDIWAQVSASYGPWAKYSQLCVFVNKVLLGHCHAHSLMYYLCLLSNTIAELQLSIEGIYYLVLHWKSFLTPGLASFKMLGLWVIFRHCSSSNVKQCCEEVRGQLGSCPLFLYSH